MAIIFLKYFYWHFVIAPVELLKIMRNYLIATGHKFLIARHFQTLFAPWHRQNPSDIGSKRKTFSDKILDAIADAYIRLIAVFVRLFIIFIGLLMEVIVFIGFLILLAVWFLWPAIVLFSLIKGLAMI